MLFYASKRKKSYTTTQKIIDKINEAFGEKIAELREEDGESDAIIGGFRAELKQRQNYYITKVVEKRCDPYEKTTIHKSATTHNSEIYIIYDLSMKAAQIFVASDINPYDSAYNRIESTDVGEQQIEYTTIDTSKTRFVNFTNPKKIRKALLWAIKKNEELAH